jgi:hypothetical protein
MAMLSYCGIDVSKDRLDVMVLPGQQSFAVRNDAAGWAELMARLGGLAIAGDKITVAHSITSSAWASSVGSRSRAFAVLRLIDNSNLTGA